MTNFRGNIVFKAAVVGDLFVRPGVLAESLRRHLTPLVGEMSIAECELQYPIEPNVSDAELREFVGTEEDVLAVASDAEILVGHMPRLSAKVIGQLPHLRGMGCTRTEPVNINVPACTARRIPIFYAPGRNARAVAEFTVGLIIAELRDIGRGHAALSQGVWRAELYLHETAPRELNGQTAGLIGFGNVGRVLPKYLLPFGMRVLAYDPYVDDEIFALYGAERVWRMDDLLSRSDIVSLHARVTAETRGFIGEHEFRTMKKGAIFINTARGPMVDYDALYRALADGHLAGAGLETFAVEPPPPDLPLLHLPNVTLTPHIAGCSQESVGVAAEMVCSDLERWLGGQPVRHCFNPEVL
jgi:D-3-phosphoglycerate dehydrogenase / 2-oxoglutarate reductase